MINAQQIDSVLTRFQADVERIGELAGNDPRAAYKGAQDVCVRVALMRNLITGRVPSNQRKKALAALSG